MATYHYDIRPVRTVPADGPGLQISDPTNPNDWKMYLVQELCHASLADALLSSFFHNKTSGLPYLVSITLLSCRAFCARLFMWGCGANHWTLNADHASSP